MNKKYRRKEQEEDGEISDSYQEFTETVNGGYNGYQLNEVDVSKLPAHLLNGLLQVKPQDGGVLSPDEILPEQGAWIVKCPKNVHLQMLLKGKKIRLNGTPNVLNADDVYKEDERLSELNPIFECVSTIQEEITESVFLLLPDLDGHFKMISTPINGYITVRQHLEELSTPEIRCKKKKRHKLPSGIKERHPIYGVDFSHALSSKRVTRSPKKQLVYMESSLENYEETGFVKLKKKKISIVEPQWENPTLNSSPKKRKTSKVQEYNVEKEKIAHAMNTHLNSENYEEPDFVKLKKRKSSIVEPQWENSSPKKRKVSKLQEYTELQVKIKKEKIAHAIDTHLNSENYEEPDFVKLKKRKSSIVESQCENPTFNSSPKKRKSSKLQEYPEQKVKIKKEKNTRIRTN